MCESQGNGTTSMSARTIRIGGASGYWGDAHSATAQLLTAPLDYIVYDYLAEITMSIMARARAANPAMGYAHDFVSAVLKRNLRTIAQNRVKVISNAGGVNPRACAAAIRALLAELGLDLKVATVLGDDLIDRKDEIAKLAPKEMYSGAPFPKPESVMSINAYLGGFPIAEALREGADIVITGRCVDSAVTLGACIHAFGWTAEAHDLLAAGSLAGHILECGAQATGGNFTDWESVRDIDRIGYPIAEIAADGSFICTKPEDTGGIVNRGTIAEQMLYEIGDPQAYILPDVICDFSGVTIEKVGDNRVLVRGARGRPAPDTYKTSTTYEDGYRGGLSATFYGLRSEHKARLYAEAVFSRARRALRERNLGDFTETSVELIGSESHYGEAARQFDWREVTARVSAKHPEKAAVEILTREAIGLGLAAPPSLSGGGNRTSSSPVVRLFSLAIPKRKVEVSIDFGDRVLASPAILGEPFDPATLKRPAPPPAPRFGEGATVMVSLMALAWGRSGDKGDKANIGIIARKPEYYPYIRAALTEAAVARRFSHFLRGKVERFDLPGINGLNFLLHDVLGGGGIASLRSDPQAKGYAQLLLDHPIAVPERLATADALPILAAA